MREVGVDLDRDVAVASLGLLPHEAKEVACISDVAQGEREEHGVGVVFDCRRQLGVVGAAVGERLLEDARVGGHPDDGVVAHSSSKRARLEQVAREEVDPDALTELLELV